LNLSETGNMLGILSSELAASASVLKLWSEATVKKSELEVS
jgi:hypothetical protein